MSRDPETLDAEETQAALAGVSQWKQDPEAPVACPRCQRSGAGITDGSARPYAEWFKIACDGCGLDATLHIPMAPPPP